MMMDKVDEAVENIVAEAMEHDRKMEESYDSPIDDCITIAADTLGVSRESTYVVMFSFVLGSYKALCSSSELHDDHGTYCEVVFDKDSNEWYAIKYEETDRQKYIAYKEDE